jgi:transglutaminase-like putative cysteine protease
MTVNYEEYLQPSELCDFDRCPEIRDKALELALGCRNRKEMFRRIFDFVKELPYGLDDWDVAASETLAKGWGMCSGKVNLLVALLRSLAIPARYRVFRIRAEVGLWGRITGDDALAQRLGPAPSEQDHVDCEVWLGRWSACDPGRDTPLERGMVALGLSLEREAIADASGRVPYLILANFDQWARERQDRRMVRQNRGEIFARVNEQFWRIRTLGRHGSGRGE